jgi:hypothetical protein
MNGVRTGIVLGAGASYCYDGGPVNLPTQADIIGRLFFGASTGGPSDGFPSIVGPAGLKHSLGLARFLRAHLDLPEHPTDSKIDYWTAIQAKGYTLESLYGELELALAGRPDLLADFEAIVRTAVLEPTRDRTMSTVCPLHRRLAEALEPGDWILDFNWDSVMADALLYYSHLWFPADGFGIPISKLLLPGVQKRLPIQSLVHLLHAHGSVLIFEHLLDDGGRIPLYLGPRQFSYLGALMHIAGINPKPGTSGGFPHTPEIEAAERKLGRGAVLFEDRWFTPIFTPPSKHKAIDAHPYIRRIRTQIHSRLPTTQKILIAGYSFPDADRSHLDRLFVREILSPDLELQVVNPQNNDPSFRAGVRALFGALADSADYGVTDFRAFAMSLCAPIGEADA